ncbi:MAG: lipoate--protein ligase [Nitrososphaerales archaeon]
MKSFWRVLDTGFKSAAENMALDDVILDCKAMELIPNTIRFLRFKPPCVLIGYHQDVEHEVRLDYVKANNIDVNRRITGGGAIYFDENTIGWEIFASKSSIEDCNKIEDLFEIMCKAPIKALRKIGINATFRPKNDIEVNGRKISGTGGTERGCAFLFQGTLLTDFDIESMIKSLRIPIVKLKDKGIQSVKQRITCVKWELGYTLTYEEFKRLLIECFEETFNIELIEGGLSEKEERLLSERLPYFQSPEWLYLDRRAPEESGIVRAIDKTKGGLIEVTLSLDKRAKVIKSILITGDFFVMPARGILDLEAALKFSSYDEESIKKIVTSTFKRYNIQIVGIEPQTIINLILEAINKMRYEELGISLEEANSIYSLTKDLSSLLNGNCKYLLLPYCSKLLSCSLRKEEGCSLCGLCSVGEAYKLGQEAGLIVKTIQNFEHLMETLKEIKKSNSSYIGCCCEAFYIKHLDDLRETKVPALLIDIDDKTCYDLGKEDEAYKGSFEGQTTLKLDLLKKLIKAIRFKDHFQNKESVQLS